MSIEVVGVGEVSEPADVVTMQIGVSASAAGAADAAAKATGLIEAVSTAIRAIVEGAELETTHYAVHPYHGRDGGPPRRFTADHHLSVRVRDIDKAGAVLEAATTAAGDSANVSGLSFSLDPTQDRRDRARAAAWADATHRAEQLAMLAGRTLGRAITITEQPRPRPGPPIMARMAVMEAAADVPIESGDASIGTTLFVAFDFAD